MYEFAILRQGDFQDRHRLIRLEIHSVVGFSSADQFRQILHRDRPTIEDLLVEFLQIELLCPCSLDILPETVKGSSSDEVGRKLAGTLLGSLNFSERFCFGLIPATD